MSEKSGPRAGANETRTNISNRVSGPGQFVDRLHSTPEAAVSGQFAGSAPATTEVVSTPRLRLLARISVHGAARFGTGDKTSWYLLALDEKLPTARMAKLLAAGDIILVPDERGSTARAALSQQATDDLNANPDALNKELAVQKTGCEHVIRYKMYSRGRSAIRGMGPVSKGCEARCSCGWDRRSNSGRAYATDYGRQHLAEKLAENIAEASGLGPEPS
jgi:hypothetical protein